MQVEAAAPGATPTPAAGANANIMPGTTAAAVVAGAVSSRVQHLTPGTYTELDFKATSSVISDALCSSFVNTSVHEHTKMRNLNSARAKIVALT